MRYLFLILLFAGCQTATTWEFGPFEKVTDANPILRPSSDYSFLDPISSETRYFEENQNLTSYSKEVPVETGTIYYWSVITSDGSISVNSDVFSFRVD